MKQQMREKTTVIMAAKPDAPLLFLMPLVMLVRTTTVQLSSVAIPMAEKLVELRQLEYIDVKLIKGLDWTQTGKIFPSAVALVALRPHVFRRLG